MKKETNMRINLCFHSNFFFFFCPSTKEFAHIDFSRWYKRICEGGRPPLDPSLNPSTATSSSSPFFLWLHNSSFSLNGCTSLLIFSFVDAFPPLLLNLFLPLTTGNYSHSKLVFSLELLGMLELPYFLSTIHPIEP